MWCGDGWSGVWCGVVWCGMVWCGVVWCGVVWCGIYNNERELGLLFQFCLQLILDETGLDDRWQHGGGSKVHLGIL